MKHFASFIWIGATRFEVNGLPENVVGLAFKSTKPQKTAVGSATGSLLIMNMQNTTKTIDLKSVRFGKPIGAFLTTESTDWQSVPAKVNATLPGLSITSFLFA